MNLTKFSIKRPLALLMAVLVVVIFGIKSYNSLTTSLMPETNMPFVFVQVIYPGASAEVVESQLTVPIEENLFSVSGVRIVESVSFDNVSVVALEFSLDVNPDQAVIDVNKRLNEVAPTFPEDAQDPIVLKLENSATPIINYALFSDDKDELTNYVENELKPELERIEGVGRVDVIGANQKQVKLTLKDRAYQLGVTPGLIADALGNKAFGMQLPVKLPLGTVEAEGDGGKELSVEVNSEFRSLEEIENFYVNPATLPQNAGRNDLDPVKISEVADVEIIDEEKETYYRANQKNAVGIAIVKQSDASDVEVAQLVKEKLGGEKSLPITKSLLGAFGASFEHEEYEPELDFEEKGIEANVTLDSSMFIKESVDGVLESLTEGIILTGIFLLLFLKNIKSTFIVLLAIPTSILVTFIGMSIFGFTLNVLSLLGVAMSIGILVDDSIVVIENIFAKLRSIKDPKEAALVGRMEIGGAAVAITLVDVVVYVPLALLTGIVGQFFREFAATVVVATLSSLVVAFTLTPMLTSRFISQEDEKGYRWLQWFGNFIERLKEGYKNLLRFLTKSKLTIGGTIIGVFVLMFVPVILVAPHLKQEFVVMGDDGVGTVAVEFPVGTSVEASNEEVKKVEAMLESEKDVKDYYVEVGGGGNFGTESNVSTISFNYGPERDRDKSSEDLTDEMQEKVREIVPESAVVTVVVASEGGGAGKDVSYVITGPEFDRIVEIGNELKAKVEEKDHLKDIQLSLGEPVDSLVIRSAEKSSGSGVGPVQILMATEGKIQSVESGTLQTQDGQEMEIIVEDKFPINTREELGQTSLGGGQTIESSTDLETVSAYKLIERKNKQRAIKLTGNLKGDIDTGSAINEINEMIEEMDLEGEYVAEIEQEGRLMEESFAELGGALLLSIVLIYIVMVALYESLTTPFVVLLSLPTAISGSFILLYILDAPLDITAMVGFIALMGLVAKNGILLVDFIGKGRSEEGMDVKTAVVEAGRRRLRPILMTTLAIIIASLPLVFGNIPGAEFRRGIATVFIGGLTTSLVLTLILVPCMYLAINGAVEMGTGLIKRVMSIGPRR